MRWAQGVMGCDGMRAVGLAAGLLATLGVLGGCETNPATGQTYFNRYSREDEIALGDSAKGQLTEEFGGAVQDASLQAYVREIGQSLAAQTESDYPSLPWEFTLLDSEVVNAFALPGGKVFITRGLAQRFTNEAQLASVMGHEVGHVTGQHVDQSFARQAGLSVAAAAAGIGAAILAGDDAGSQAAAGLAVGGGVQLLGLGLLKFDRDQEIEADALGMRYMNRAGYNPVGSKQGMQVLADLAGGVQQSDFTSTHPDPVRRVNIIQQRLEDGYPDALANPEANLFADRFRTRFLDPMNRRSPLTAGAGHAWWCAVCVADEKAGEQQSSRSTN